MKGSVFAPLAAFVLVASCKNRDGASSEVESPEIAAATPCEGRARGTRLGFNSAIRSIYQDTKDNYWVGSHAEGLAVFDGESFCHFTRADGLPSSQIRAIQQAADGTIWFETGSGIGSYENGAIRSRLSSASSDAISRLATPWLKTDGDLWLSGGGTRVYRYSKRDLHYLDLPNAVASDDEASSLITGLAYGRNGTIWVATYGGVFGLDGTTVVTIDDATLGLEQAARVHVRSILEDSKGRLWIGNNGIGVLVHSDNNTSNLSRKMGLASDADSLGGVLTGRATLEHVFSIEEDRLGNLWFGDRDTGAWKYDGEVLTNYSVESGLPTPSIWDIYLDRKGTLLFALDNGVVCQLDENTFRGFPDPISPCGAPKP